mgnify:CR=1 FL=1
MASSNMKFKRGGRVRRQYGGMGRRRTAGRGRKGATSIPGAAPTNYGHVACDCRGLDIDTTSESHHNHVVGICRQNCGSGGTISSIN